MISNKQLTLLKAPYLDKYDGIIADGAIRSGKSSFCVLGIILWAMSNFQQKNFAICGVTIATAKRNIIRPLMQMTYMRQNFAMVFRSTENLLIVKRGNKENYFFIFGGRDESSYKLIQGITLQGILFDEVALMPESFVEQGIARCSEPNAKIFFNCNPMFPSHWFKKNFIDLCASKKLQYVHFELDDNPALDERAKERYKAMYTGVFHRRYILGEWCTAEGAIYNEFINNPDDFIIDAIPEDDRLVKIISGVDFGHTQSSTAFVTIGIGVKYRNVYILEEEKIDSNGLDGIKLQQAYLSYQKNKVSKYGLASITYCDSAEPVLVRTIRNGIERERKASSINDLTKLNVTIRGAEKNAIIIRIRGFSALLSERRIKIMSKCKNLIQSLNDARWDDTNKNNDTDVRLDDGSYCVDMLDAMEYALEPELNTLLKVGGKTYDN